MTTPTIFHVANYLLSHFDGANAPEGQPGTSTMKLQKLCYYAQAWSLAWDDVPLFDEDFQAWANGPVCPELFQSHKGVFWLPPDYYKAYQHDFTKDQRETMDSVLEGYAAKEPIWLSELTHRERPWKETRIGVRAGERCQRVIPKGLMQEYYSSLVGDDE